MGSQARELCPALTFFPPLSPWVRVPQCQMSNSSLQVGVAAARIFWAGHDQDSHVVDCLKLPRPQSLWLMTYLHFSLGNPVTINTNEQAWDPSSGLVGPGAADRFILLFGRISSHMLSCQSLQGHFSTFWHCSTNQPFGSRLFHQHRRMRAMPSHKTGCSI